MSLRCTLFGHLYGDPQVEREKQKEGKEVVTTVREVKGCSRCGKRLVVSQNKEVTTVETATEGGAPVQNGPGGGGGQDPDAAGGDGSHSTADDQGLSGSHPATAGGSRADTGYESGEDLPPAHKEDATIITEEGEEVDPEEYDDADNQRGLDDWEPDIDEESEEQGQPQSGTESSSEGVTVPSGEFSCPECGFSTAVQGSSLRAGDFCPECHAGVLEQHAE